MKLSIIIVNYNVKYFLEQCLQSVMEGVRNMEAEVFVVDNKSVDGSVQMLKEKFPDVITLVNTENVGFSKANNQAIKLAKGEYVLLLNPDTLVENVTFEKVIAFMDEHPEAGGLGVKMVDGKGKFLPESKRGLPTPMVAFYKIFGLSRLFPGSRRFGQYHLTYLDQDSVHEVDVLSGAFMLLRKSVLDDIGLLDETFFMYGEDIDLSYRITKAGYKNFYYPETRIIHYKGESTKKGSINYVFVFYNAMVIFARKHFSQKNARLFSFFINIAIYFRAFLAISKRIFLKALLPVLDAILLFSGIVGIKNYWESNVIFTSGDGHFPIELVSVAIPLYIVIWLLAVYFSSGYDRPVKLSKLFQGLLAGTAIILIIYALLPEKFRFSRALIILGSLWGFMSMSGLRLLLHTAGFSHFALGIKKNNRVLIVGENEEAKRVSGILRNSVNQPAFIGLIGVAENSNGHPGYLGNLKNLEEICRVFRINEVVFCSKDIPPRMIIDKMTSLSQMQLEYRIAPPESISIIGSKSINTLDDAYVVEIDSLDKTRNKRNKRLLDVVASVLFLLCAPLLILIIRSPLKYIQNIFSVFFGKKSWVGYHYQPSKENLHLPKIRKGVLDPIDGLPAGAYITKDVIERLNLLYARDYKVMNDLRIISKNIRKLGK